MRTDLKWMVRKLKGSESRAKSAPAGVFVLHGPMGLGDVVDRIKRTEYTGLDEVCPEGGYWFFLSEENEVREWLGIDPAAVSTLSAAGRADSTQTETEIVNLSGSAVASATAGERPRAPVREKFRPVTAAPRFERITLWRAVIWVLAFSVGVILYSIFHRLSGG